MRFLVLQHVPHESPGLLAEVFSQENIALETAELWHDRAVPDIEGYEGLIVMGGPMGVNDPESSYPTKAGELRVIEAALRRDIPFLGICLGSQLLAAALGGRVYPNPSGKEVGVRTVKITDAGKRDLLFGTLDSPVPVLEWHGDAFDLPLGSTLLAAGDACANQGYCYGKAYGLLFHLEMRASMVERLVEVDRPWIHTPHPIDEQALLQGFRDHEADMHRACQALARAFVAGAH